MASLGGTPLAFVIGIFDNRYSSSGDQALLGFLALLPFRSFRFALPPCLVFRFGLSCLPLPCLALPCLRHDIELFVSWRLVSDVCVCYFLRALVSFPPLC